jgi:hypothetical protein
MKLKSILLEMLTELSVADLQKKYVKSEENIDGIIPQDVFNQILDASIVGQIDEKTPKYSYTYATWLTLRVIDNMNNIDNIKNPQNNKFSKENLSKWEEYLKIFEKYKNKFEEKDISRIKEPEAVQKFLDRILDIKQAIKSDPSKAGGSNKLEKYKEFYIGSVDGFSVFKLDQGRKDLYGISCDLGSGTEWCTATGKTRQHFDNYIDQGPLFIFIKKGSDEKYQFSYEASQFMDKNDNSVL